MSIFRPHKTKPRQFNYIPRFYDPVKEERERRRRELHGTSTEDDNKEYTPGRYIRTQREAREVAREERGSDFSKVRNLLFIAAIAVVGFMVLYPRIMRFVEYAADEKAIQQAGNTTATDIADSTAVPTITLYEQHEDIDFNEFESLSPEIINEIEEWQNSVGTITIYDNDVDIVDGKRVE